MKCTKEGVELRQYPLCPCEGGNGARKVNLETCEYIHGNKKREGEAREVELQTRLSRYLER